MGYGRGRRIPAAKKEGPQSLITGGNSGSQGTSDADDTPDANSASGPPSPRAPGHRWRQFAPKLPQMNGLMFEDLVKSTKFIDNW